MEKGGYVYIMASRGKRLYTGVTSELMIRVNQHKSKKYPDSHAARYNINQLVYYQGFAHILEAITRESQIKNMHRVEKIALIVAVNPDWKDLSAAWGGEAIRFDESRMKPPTRFGGDDER